MQITTRVCREEKFKVKPQSNRLGHIQSCLLSSTVVGSLKGLWVKSQDVWICGLFLVFGLPVPRIIHSLLQLNILGFEIKMMTLIQATCQGCCENNCVEGALANESLSMKAEHQCSTFS